MARWRHHDHQRSRRRLVHPSPTTTPFHDAVRAAWLLRQPQRSAPVVPAATARVEIDAESSVRVGAGTAKMQLAASHGIDLVPRLVWLDDRGDLFASSAGWCITVRRGTEHALPTPCALELP